MPLISPQLIKDINMGICQCGLTRIAFMSYRMKICAVNKQSQKSRYYGVTYVFINKQSSK